LTQNDPLSDVNTCVVETKFPVHNSPVSNHPLHRTVALLQCPKSGISLVNGNNTFTVIATDSAGRKDANSITLNLPTPVSFL
jgi:hypothetical protein